MPSMEDQEKPEQKKETQTGSGLTGKSMESNRKSTESTGSHDLRESLQAEKKAASFQDRMGSVDNKKSTERTQRSDHLQSSGGGALPENKPPAMSDSGKSGSEGNKEKKEASGKGSESGKEKPAGSDARVRLVGDSGDSKNKEDKWSAKEQELTKRAEKLEGMKQEFQQQSDTLRKDVNDLAQKAKEPANADSAAIHEDWHRVTQNAKSAEFDVYKTEKALRETNDQLAALRKERQQSVKG